MLRLPSVTLCAAASVNVAATVAALQASLDQVDFAHCLLFTDQPELVDDARIRTIRIPRLVSSRAYSQFMLEELVRHIETDHLLVVQWDGFVLDAAAWDPNFLEFDYIGSPWPQFGDGIQVGNGGFSLRSRRLLEACLDPAFVQGHPEDVAICRSNRELLEGKHRIGFADLDSAERFAFERTAPRWKTFGFHGIFNMIPVLGCDRFWQLYNSLDDRRTMKSDYRLLMRQARLCDRPWPKWWRLTADFLRT